MESLIKSINTFNKNTASFFKVISTFNYYITHPADLWKLITVWSYPVLIFVCGVSIIAWVIGYKKAGKIAIACTLIYYAMTIIAAVI